MVLSMPTSQSPPSSTIGTAAPNSSRTWAARAQACRANGESVLALTIDSQVDGVRGLALPADPEAYGHDLYAALRELDARRADRLLVESPPQQRAWFAVLDRLARAAADVPDDVP